MKMLCLLLGLSFSLTAYANPEEKVVNVYNWVEAISEPLLRKFEAETGIKVNYSTYSSNEVLYAKLKLTPNAGYDVVVPSTYFIDRMRKQHMLQKLDKSKLPHFKHLNKALLNKSFDPNNEYSIPFIWNTTGILANQYTPKKWADLWQPIYQNRLLLLDDTREVFAMALLKLGYSANETDPKRIHEAFLALKQLLPNVRLFNIDAQKAIYIDEDILVGMGWSGDAYLIHQDNPRIAYLYPEEGFVISIDSMVIPANAPHVDNAHKFIDFMLRPENAKEVTLATGFAVANKSAVALLPEVLRNSQIAFPSDAILRRGEILLDTGQTATLYEKYFELLKLES